MRLTVTDPSVWNASGPMAAAIESLLAPFQVQSARIRSLLAIGAANIFPAAEGPGTSLENEAVLVRFAMGNAPEAPRPNSVDPDDLLASLAGQARELSGFEDGDDLLLLPAQILSANLPGAAGQFRFRAVAVILPHTAAHSSGTAWRLRRSLFDLGLVCIGSAMLAGVRTLCFLASDAVRRFDVLDVDSRGRVAMSGLAVEGRFANQLFRYAFVKLYALRHGLTTALPTWEGRGVFGLEDPPCSGLDLPTISYPGFAENDRELWDLDDPPIDIDVEGYFQELPECWRPHRALLQHLFELDPSHRKAIDAWVERITDSGRRTLVAVHVRRGDYRGVQDENIPWLRLVPVRWYVEWLRALWPTLRDPVLFVATDEPEAILPAFQEFHPVAPSFGPPAGGLPDHLRDFEILRRAGTVAICNGSYGRMASILAYGAQTCFIVSFETESFVPYQPWIDPGFWARFADSWSARRRTIPDPELPAGTPALFFDVSDLLLDLLHQTTLSGIQRVQGEILRNLPGAPHSEPRRFVVLSRSGGVLAIDESALFEIIEDVRSDATSPEEVRHQLHSLLDHAVPCTVRSGDTFLELGAFWNVRGVGALLQELKRCGVRIGVFIHDIIPMVAPEYFEAASSSGFIKSVVEALTFADFVLTTSEFNRSCLRARMGAGLDPKPIQLVPLGHELSRVTQNRPKVSQRIARILEQEYVLCVGTIEVRKNPTYLLHLWKLLARSGRAAVPMLVLAGRKGWMVEDFLRQLEACNGVGGRVVVLHGVTDVELDLLYRNCLLTTFPSFVEGWGLPVGESLTHGKICLGSAVGGIPEVGGNLVDFIDPYNVRDGLEKLLGYLDDPERRRAREREIASHFIPRTWQEMAHTFLGSVHSQTQQTQPMNGAASIRLPADRYLPLSSDPPAVLMDEVDGRLSAELMCVSGWARPEVSGVRAAEPAAVIRFRTDLAAGTKINLVLRLAARGRAFRIRVRSGSGAETEIAVAEGVEKLAALSCAVEHGQLVTARLSSIGAKLMGNEDPRAAYWSLQGVLYFDPQKATGPGQPVPAGAARPAVAEPPEPVIGTPPPGRRIRLLPAPQGEMGEVATFDEFLQTADSCWQSAATIHRKAPVFADDSDRQAFLSACGNSAFVPQLGPVQDALKFCRRSDMIVSMSRFTEGSVFNAKRVWRAFGFLKGAPAKHAPWLLHEDDGCWLDEASLADAPFHDGSCLIFFNGNLHNYYHWVIEGLLGLDILTRALAADPARSIVLPKSMDLEARFDHRGSIEIAGLGSDLAETGASFLRVREAIWIDTELIQTMPALYVKDFQQRIAALYSDARPRQRRRLLVARRGPTRMIQNLSQVEDLLSKYGFETIYLEGMNVREQILLFQSAEFVAASHGAGLSNLIFCQPGTKVIEWMPAVELRQFFWLISEKLELVHAMQFCATVERPDFQSSMHVDIGKLRVLLRALKA